MMTITDDVGTDNLDERDLAPYVPLQAGRLAAAAGLSRSYPDDWHDCVGPDRRGPPDPAGRGQRRPRGAVCEHILLAGVPGLGKTSLALLAAAELGTGSAWSPAR